VLHEESAVLLLPLRERSRFDLSAATVQDTPGQGYRDEKHKTRAGDKGNKRVATQADQPSPEFHHFPLSP
jgi:hypothetical protein